MFQIGNVMQILKPFFEEFYTIKYFIIFKILETLTARRKNVT